MTIEQSARRDIVEAGRRMYLRGYISGNDGNLSARVSDNVIIATPSGVSKGFMTEDMLVKLDLDGCILSYGCSAALDDADGSGSANTNSDGNDSASGDSNGSISGDCNGGANSDGKHGLKPSSEIRMHLAIYRKSPKLRAVCHAHPPVSASFAAAGVALDKPFLQETVMLLGVIPVAKYAAPGSDELADGAASFCLDYHGALLEHHGAVTWGDSVMQALYRMESVEYTATVAMYSKMLGFSRTLDIDKIDKLTAKRAEWGICIPPGNWNIEV